MCVHKYVCVCVYIYIYIYIYIMCVCGVFSGPLLFSRESNQRTKIRNGSTKELAILHITNAKIYRSLLTV